MARSNRHRTAKRKIDQSVLTETVEEASSFLTREDGAHAGGHAGGDQPDAPDKDDDCARQSFSRT